MWWENEFLTRVEGRLFLGRRPATEIAARFGTPLFVYSRSRILANYDRLVHAFSAPSPLITRILYAMKANPYPGILRLLKRRGSSIDAVSPGEVEAARRAGFPADGILFTGTSVSVEDLRRVFAVDGVIVNIDALEQLDLMGEVRQKEFPAKSIRVSVRWNPGIGRGFNPKVVTAGARTSDGTPIKFGIEEGRVPAAFERALESGFEPVGLHQHLGSGWTREDFPFVRDTVDRMVRLAARLEKDGVPLQFLDFGGGIGPLYDPGQTLFPVEKYGSYIIRRVASAGLNIKSIAVEPGKYLVADAGVLLVRVEYLKTSHGQRFACVNAGTFTSLPRPAIYAGARHEILLCERLGSRTTVPVTVAGNLCETGDVFGRDVPLPEPRRGDILAILHAGAYARSMASNFNLREIPREILV
ncbi:MAG: diaminopimelate decarboxylase [Candidatus Aminicenantes bacterium RBG_16_63_16]|nr:MAG: diaminopimelate decarboxylase [Candidatus Aminicenantes bacterium RBG_16_63_16]